MTFIELSEEEEARELAISLKSYANREKRAEELIRLHFHNPTGLVDKLQREAAIAKSKRITMEKGWLTDHSELPHQTSSPKKKERRSRHGNIFEL